MPELTEEQIEELKRNSAKSAIDNLLKASGIESEDALLSGLKLVKEKNPLELEKKVSSLETSLADAQLSKKILSATHKTGFKDSSYAEFLYKEKLASANEEEKKTLNPDSFFNSLRENKEMKHHFYGRNAASSGGNGNPDPTGDNSGKPLDLSNASPAEIQKRISELGFSPRL